jgi:hypothetical protein
MIRLLGAYQNSFWKTVMPRNYDNHFYHMKGRVFMSSKKHYHYHLLGLAKAQLLNKYVIVRSS